MSPDYAYSDAAFVIKQAKKTFWQAANDKERENAEIEEENVRRMVQFCQNMTDCRRTQLLGYYEEKFDSEKCGGMCDNCRNPEPVTQEDVSETACSLIRLVLDATRKDMRVTRTMVVETLLGKLTATNRRKGFEELEGFGVSHGMPKDRVERIHDRLVADGELEAVSLQNGGAYHNDYTQVCPMVIAW